MEGEVYFHLQQTIDTDAASITTLDVVPIRYVVVAQYSLLLLPPLLLLLEVVEDMKSCGHYCVYYFTAATSWSKLYLTSLV